MRLRFLLAAVFCFCVDDVISSDGVCAGGGTSGNICKGQEICYCDRSSDPSEQCACADPISEGHDGCCNCSCGYCDELCPEQPSPPEVETPPLPSLEEPTGGICLGGGSNGNICKNQEICYCDRSDDPSEQCACGDPISAGHSGCCNCSCGYCDELCGPPDDLCTDVNCDERECQTGTCDSSTGECVYENVSNGEVCDDLNDDTSNDECQDGACQGTDLCIDVNCDARECQTGICDSSTGECVYENVSSGEVCDDLNDNTSNDECHDGVCQGTDLCENVICDDVQCKIGSCDRSSGECVYENAEQNLPCDDENYSTNNDLCQNGYCIGQETESDCHTWGPWVDRDDPSGNADAEDRHNIGPEDIGCEHPIAIECVLVSDESVSWYQTGENFSIPCTLEEGFHCLNIDNPEGGCSDYKTRYKCCDNDCEAWGPWIDRDDPSGNADAEARQYIGPEDIGCEHPIAIECVLVSDESVSYDQTGEIFSIPCTLEEGLHCLNIDNPEGGCSDYKTRYKCCDLCDDVLCDTRTCQIGSCDPLTGECIYENEENGAHCDDENDETSDDSCQDGICVGQEVDLCEDTECVANECEHASCDTSTGECVYTSLNGQPCDDGNPETSDDQCRRGVCTGILPGTDPLCEHGIIQGTHCCSTSCGTCGGQGCSGRPGGASNCCTTHFQNSCESNSSPCIITDVCEGVSCESNECQSSKCNPVTGQCEIYNRNGQTCENKSGFCHASECVCSSTQQCTASDVRAIIEDLILEERERIAARLSSNGLPTFYVDDAPLPPTPTEV